MMIHRLFAPAVLFIAAVDGASVHRAPWCIPRGGAASGYAAQLEGVKAAVMDKAMASVSRVLTSTLFLDCGSFL